MSQPAIGIRNKMGKLNARNLNRAFDEYMNVAKRYVEKLKFLEKELSDRSKLPKDEDVSALYKLRLVRYARDFQIFHNQFEIAEPKYWAAFQTELNGIKIKINNNNFFTNDDRKMKNKITNRFNEIWFYVSNPKKNPYLKNRENGKNVLDKAKAYLTVELGEEKVLQGLKDELTNRNKNSAYLYQKMIELNNTISKVFVKDIQNVTTEEINKIKESINEVDNVLDKFEREYYIFSEDDFEGLFGGKGKNYDTTMFTSYLNKLLSEADELDKEIERLKEPTVLREYKFLKKFCNSADVEKIKQLELDIKKITEQRDRLITEADGREKDLTDMQKEIQRLQDQITQLNAELKNAQEQKDNYERLASRVQLRLTQKENEIKESIDKHQQEIDELQKKIDDLTRQLQIANGDKVNLNDQIKEKNVELLKQQTEITELTNKLTANNDQIERLNNQITEITNNKNDLEVQINELNRTIAAKNDEIQKLQNDHQANTDMIDVLQKQLNELEDHNEKLKEINERKELELDGANEELMERTNIQQKLIEELNQAKSVNEALQKQVNICKAIHTKTLKQYDELKDDSDTKIKTLTEQLKQKNDAVKKLEEQLKEVETEKETHNEELENKIKELNKKINKKKQNLEKITETYESLNAEYKKLQRKYEAILKNNPTTSGYVYNYGAVNIKPFNVPTLPSLELKQSLKFFKTTPDETGSCNINEMPDNYLMIQKTGMKLVFINATDIYHVFIDDSETNTGTFGRGLPNIVTTLYGLLNPLFVVTSDILCRVNHLNLCQQISETKDGSYNVPMIISGGMFFGKPYNKQTNKQQQLTDTICDRLKELKELKELTKSKKTKDQYNFTWLYGPDHDESKNIHRKYVDKINWPNKSIANLEIKNTAGSIEFHVRYRMPKKIGKYLNLSNRIYLLTGESEIGNNPEGNILPQETQEKFMKYGQIYVNDEKPHMAYFLEAMSPYINYYEYDDRIFYPYGHIYGSYTIEVKSKINGENYVVHDRLLDLGKRGAFVISSTSPLKDSIHVVRNEADLMKYVPDYVCECERIKTVESKYSHFITTNSHRVISNDNDSEPYMRMYGGTLPKLANILIISLIVIVAIIIIIVVITTINNKDKPNRATT